MFQKNSSQQKKLCSKSFSTEKYIKKNILLVYIIYSSFIGKDLLSFSLIKIFFINFLIFSMIKKNFFFLYFSCCIVCMYVCMYAQRVYLFIYNIIFKDNLYEKKKINKKSSHRFNVYGNRDKNEIQSQAIIVLIIIVHYQLKFFIKTAVALHGYENIKKLFSFRIFCH